MLGGNHDPDNVCCALRVELSTQQMDRFLGLRLANPTEKQDGPQRVEHLCDLLMVGEENDVPDEHSPEVRVHARWQKEREPDTILPFPGYAGMNRDLQIFTLLRFAFFAQLQRCQFAGTQALLCEEINAAAADVFNAGGIGCVLDPVTGGQARRGTALRTWLLRLAESSEPPLQIVQPGHRSDSPASRPAAAGRTPHRSRPRA